MESKTLQNIFIIILVTIIIYQIYGYFMNSNNIKQIIYFSSATCGHCARFQSIWDQFVHDYAHQNQNIQLIQIDTNDSNYRLSQMYNVQGFPTVLAIENNIQKLRMMGPKTYQNLVQFWNAVQ